jgi:hypothetical protein
MRAADGIRITRLGEEHPRTHDVFGAGAGLRERLEDDLETAAGLNLRVRIA